MDLLRKIILEEVKLILAEGGLAGHMQHLYDNEDLSFNDIKDIFQLAASGKLENTTEKVDGQNIFITWNVAQGKLKAARNKTDIKIGGMDADGVAQKFASHKDVVQSTFKTGYDIISQALSALDSTTLTRIFGPNGNVWFSVEIINPDNSNIINYNRNAIVFHKSGSTYDSKGNPLVNASTEANFNELIAHIQKMQEKVASTFWQLMTPVAVRLKNMADQTPLKNALQSLQQVQGEYGLTDASTVGDLIETRLRKDVVSNLGLPHETEQLIIDRLMLKPGADLKKIKAAIAPEFYPKVDALVKNQTKIRNEAVRPLESIVHDFAVELLKNVESVLALHPDKSIEKIRQEVQGIIGQVQSSGNQQDIDFLNQQLQRLKSVDNITSSMEGITFQYKGQTYKLTGNFAPINQILGIYKFKRTGSSE
jgi:hypothetical protein